MSKLLQLRGGTTTEHASFTGAVREVTVDTTKDTLVVHDGTTAGGHALSTAADVSAALATLVDSAPATLNTLNELAAALNDDASFSTTVTDSIALKAPLASPTFTGNIGMPNGSIDLAMMNANSVGSGQYVDGSILTVHLANTSVTTAKIAGDAINGSKIADDAINSEHYVDGSIDNQHISGMAASKLTGDLPAISGANLTGVQPFPSGTVMVFHQTAAPTGWTKSTTHNDKALRVVSGNGGGNGGTHDLSSPPSLAHTHTGAAHVHSIGAHSHGNNLSAASHTLSTSQMPSHTHTQRWGYGGGSANGLGGYAGQININQSGGQTLATGGGGSHSHSMSGSVSNSTAFNSSSAGGDATSSTTPTSFAPKYIDVIICAKD